MSFQRGGEFEVFLQTLKEKSEISEVIGSYIKLERRGQSFWACCPFHHEKTPSFSVNAADQYYHCFGCGASGDVIGFVKEYENVDFMQAVQILALRAKMEVPSIDGRDQREAQKRKREKDRLTLLMKDAARFYLQNLYSGKADEHLAYAAKRGLLPSTMKKFGLGASLDYVSLPRHLLEKGYSKEELLKSGACALTQDGRLIDAQGGRFIIPIINHFDEVVAFGGRLLKPSDFAKYKNTKETVLFDKGKTLFNLNLVKKHKREREIESLIMVEGYMDAISLYQAGFFNVVASMGTSLTQDQARLCKRYSENVFISYDGDFAGQKASLRGLEILKREGLRVRVVPLPEGLDPDDVIKRQGAEGYSSCLARAMPLIDFRLLELSKQYNKSDPYEKREYVKEALKIVAQSESETEREELLKRLSKECDVSLSSLKSDFQGEEPPKKESAPQREEGDAYKKAERFVLSSCLFNRPYAKNCDLNSLSFDDETHEKIAEYISEEREESGKVRPSGIFDLLQKSEELEKILDLSSGALEGENAERYFQDCLRLLKQRAQSERIESLRTALSEAESPEEKRGLLELLNEQLKKQKR